MCTYGFFLLVWCNKLGMVHCIYRGVTGYNFKRKLCLLLFRLLFLFSNSEYSDEMLHCAAFHLGLHCLPKMHIHIGVTSIQRVNPYKPSILFVGH